jgi:preprotein translocase subunit Sec63
LTRSSLAEAARNDKGLAKVATRKAAEAALNEKKLLKVETRRLAEKLEKLVKKQKAVTSKREAVTNRLAKQLATTQHQLDALCESWQKQQNQFIIHKEDIVELDARLDDSELRFKEVAESLAVQTTKLKSMVVSSQLQLSSIIIYSNLLRFFALIVYFVTFHFFDVHGD